MITFNLCILFLKFITIPLRDDSVEVANTNIAESPSLMPDAKIQVE